MKTDPLRAYRHTRIKTATQGQLIVMLYDEGLKQLKTALNELESGQPRLDLVAVGPLIRLPRPAVVEHDHPDDDRQQQQRRDGEDQVQRLQVVDGSFIRHGVKNLVTTREC